MAYVVCIESDATPDVIRKADNKVQIFNEYLTARLLADIFAASGFQINILPLVEKPVGNFEDVPF